LAFARATGETMAVMTVIGNSPQFPKLLTKAETVPALIALEIGMSEVGSKHYSVLFASAFVLLTTVMIINIIFFILNKMRRIYIEK
ncbi:MAG: phosphate ABC transporter permease subunit PstC, partial [Pseudoleptotrichia goodfellowii]|nr:phosphate ABC transporter permease subunit PstC [Pseudoleptotrichia goodfellowii]